MSNEGKFSQEDLDNLGDILTLNQLEALCILRAMKRHAGNKTRAAEALGISIKTLYNKLHEYGLVESK